MRTLRTTLIATALVAALACGRGDPDAARVTADSGPHVGGQVTVAIPEDVTTFNEYQWAGEASEFEIMDMLFPTLMEEQPDYEQHPPSFAPRLATSWEFSRDNRVLTFQLRKDAVWSDGVPVTAADVVFTFQVQTDPELGATGLEIKDFIDKVEAVDEHTVRFHFSRVYPYQLMDANDGHIIPAHAWGAVPTEKWKSTDFEERLVTCGPFRLASHTPDQTLVLERDPGYWDAPRPYLDRVVFRVIPDINSQLNQLLAGHIDLVQAVPPREADRVRADADLELVEFPSRAWAFIAWNNRSPLFSDRRVRRAMTLAIDRASAVASVYHGFANLSNGPILSTMWAYNRDLPVLPFDQAEAERLLSAAGWKDSDGDGVRDRNGRAFAFDLLFPATNTIRRDLALLIQADLARLGVVVRPVPTELGSLLARADSGQFDAMLSAWAEATKIELTSTWTTPTEGQGTNNFVRYSNPEVDRLVAAAREEPDYTRAKVLYDRIQELIVGDQPVTFLYEANQLVGISRSIRNANINSAGVFFNIEEWYREP